MKVNIVIGIKSIGKSTYIKEHKNESDIVLDVSFPKKYNITFRSFYVIIADVEKAIRKYQNTDKTIWVEYIFVPRFRRELLFNCINSIKKDLDRNTDFPINLYLVTDTLNVYVKNHVHEQLNPKIKINKYFKPKTTLSFFNDIEYYNHYNNLLTKEFPCEDRFGWSNIYVVISSTGDIIKAD